MGTALQTLGVQLGGCCPLWGVGPPQWIWLDMSSAMSLAQGGPSASCVPGSPWGRGMENGLQMEALIQCGMRAGEGLKKGARREVQSCGCRNEPLISLCFGSPCSTALGLSSPPRGAPIVLHGVGVCCGAVSSVLWEMMQRCRGSRLPLPSHQLYWCCFWTKAPIEVLVGAFPVPMGSGLLHPSAAQCPVG